MSHYVDMVFPDGFSSEGVMQKIPEVGKISGKYEVAAVVRNPKYGNSSTGNGVVEFTIVLRPHVVFDL